ncbi:MAG: fibronectin type III domain-containing protein [Oscillospiraceae bacterium]|nr:fibronectin type III domain-containing protein [Oscillospiraceae bacterium]
MKKLKVISITFFVIIITVVLTVVPMLSVNAAYYFDGAKMIKDSGYKYYRAWSQDQFPWHNTKPSDAWESDWMNQYGCSTVAMAKMFVEAGVASPYTTTPGTLMSKYGSPSKGIGDIGIYWSTLAGQFGMTCESFQYYPNGSFYNTAMSFFNRTDKQYHLLLKVSLYGGGSHYVQIDRQATVDKGEIIYNDSTNTQDGGTRYNTAKEYYNTISLRKLSSAGFTPEYFVVFCNKDKTQVASIEEVNSTTAQIKWYPNGCCQHYILYRRNKGETTWTGKRIATMGNTYAEGERTYTDSTLTMGKTYEYTVRGYYKSGSTTVYLDYDKTGKEITTHPDPPKMKKTESIDHNTIKVYWNAVKNADGYRVYRKATDETSWTKLTNSVTKLNFTDTTAVTGKEYYYTARAYVGKSSYLGAYDKTGIKGVALPAKVTLVKTESLDFNKIEISWNKVKGVDGYAIYRKASGDKSYKRIGEVKGGSTVSFTDLSSVTGTKYIYTVRAYKTANDTKYLGSYDAAGIEGISYTNPPKIKTLKSNEYDKINLSWSKVNGASGYIVYYKASEDKTFTKAGDISGNGNTEFTVKNLKCCVKYDFKVKGYRIIDNKKYGGFVSEVVSGYTLPAEPALKSTSSIDYKTIKINWTKVPGATGYVVYRKTTEKYQRIAEISNSSTLSFKDKNAVTGVKYTYTVRAYCTANGITKYSAYENYIYGTAYPAKPKLLTVDSVDYNKIQVNWEAVAGADGYYVYRKTDKVGYKKIATLNDGKVCTYQDKGLVCGDSYTYTVRAFRNQSGSTFTGDYEKGITGKAVPAAPKYKVSVASYNSLLISWNTVGGAGGYRVYYKKANDKKFSVLATFDNPKLTSCTHKSLATGEKYTYSVRAYYKKDKKKVWGQYDSIGTTNMPQTLAPAITSVKGSSYNSISVEWKSVSGANGYAVYRKNFDDTKWTRLEIIKGNSVCSYVDKNVSCGVKYSYTVRSYRTVNNSNKYGLYNKQGVAAMAIPETPLVSASSLNYNKIKLNWGKCMGANGYKIYRKEENGKYEMIKKCTSKSVITYTDTVECGVNYIYYVTAFVTVDKIEYGSYDSKEIQCKAIPLTPSLISATSPEEHTAKITWGAVAGASGYYIYRKEANEHFKLIYDEQSTTTRTFTDKNLESGVKYTYTVKAYRICNAGYISGGNNKTGLSVIVK